MDFLVTYGTTDGQTEQIAGRLASGLRARGHRATVMDIRGLPSPFDLSRFDGILVGGSLHAGGYQWRVRHFVRKYRAVLSTRPSAFFSVCLAAASRDAKSRQEAHEIPARFLGPARWSPDLVAVFAGAARFTRYGFLRRPIMRRICEKELGIPIDTRQDYVMTDWKQVDEFAGRFAALTTGHPASAEAHAPGP